VDLPVFENPARTQEQSVFLIPAWPPLPDFLCLAREDFNLL